MKRLIALAIALGAVGSINAQSTIYRCGNSYSDEPCSGGKTVDIRPTEGAHSMSGQKRVSSESITRQMHHEFDKAYQPLTGITPEEAARQREDRRHKQIPRIEVEPRNADLRRMIGLGSKP